MKNTRNHHGKKLSLNRTTLRHLSEAETLQVNGGNEVLSKTSPCITLVTVDGCECTDYKC